MKHRLPIIISALLLVTGNACSSLVDSEQRIPTVDGVIVQIERDDAQYVRILMAYPTANEGKVWLGLTRETEIFMRGRPVSRVGFDALEVGQEVKAWTTGLWLYSYPPRTDALRLVVAER